MISLLVAGSSFSKPLVKCSVATLKRTGAPFIQDGPCSEVTPKLSKCRECKPNQRGKKIPNIFCRFYAFRRYSNDYCYNIFLSHVHARMYVLPFQTVHISMQDFCDGTLKLILSLVFVSACARLKFSPKGAVTIAGFSELSEAEPDDIEPWLPKFPSKCSPLTFSPPSLGRCCLDMVACSQV